jgi:hypothetical protein
MKLGFIKLGKNEIGCYLRFLGEMENDDDDDDLLKNVSRILRKDISMPFWLNIVFLSFLREVDIVNYSPLAGS